MSRETKGDEPVYYSSKSVERVLGINKMSLNRLVRAEVVRPEGGGNRGKRYKFTLDEVVALTAGQYYAGLGFDQHWCNAATRLVADVGVEAIIELCRRSPVRYPQSKLWISPGCWIVRGGKRLYLPGQLSEPPDPDALARTEAELGAPLDLAQVLAMLDHKFRALEGLGPRTYPDDYQRDFGFVEVAAKVDAPPSGPAPRAAKRVKKAKKAPTKAT